MLRRISLAVHGCLSQFPMVQPLNYHTKAVKDHTLTALLLQAGDVESNPGPFDDLLLEEPREKFTQNKKPKRNDKTTPKYNMREEKQRNLESKIEKMADTLAILMERSNNMTGLEDRLAKVEEIVFNGPKDGQNPQTGYSKLVEENNRLRQDIEHKVNLYEARLNEADVEVSALKSQLTELMGVYDDLQVRMGLFVNVFERLKTFCFLNSGQVV